jgi:capsular polysaccharide biosynthesis protein
MITEKVFHSFNIHPTTGPKEKNILLIKKGYASIFTLKMHKIINNWMQSNIKLYNLNIIKKVDILIIERKENKSYKTLVLKNDLENDIKNKLAQNNKLNKLMKHTGKSLRSIINHKELVEFIKKYYPKKSVINVSLDYMPIFDQYQLFNNAKIIFAQHGASLANIIFMKKDSKLIEIIDKNKHNIENWFLQYSEACKVKHFQYITEKAHTTINLEHFKKYLVDNKI